MQCCFSIAAEIIHVDSTILNEVAHDGEVVMCNCYLKRRSSILIII